MEKKIGEIERGEKMRKENIGIVGNDGEEWKDKGEKNKKWKDFVLWEKFYEDFECKSNVMKKLNKRG